MHVRRAIHINEANSEFSTFAQTQTSLFFAGQILKKIVIALAGFRLATAALGTGNTMN